MLSRLQSPYPAPTLNRSSLLGGLFMGVFVGVFLFYFKPFGLHNEPYGSRPELIAAFGVLSMLSFWLMEAFLPWCFPGVFKDTNWRVWHQIVFYLLLIQVIATANGLFINYIQNLDFSWPNYGLITGQTMAIGVLPVTMIVLYRYNAKLAYNLERAIELDARSRERTIPEPPVPAQTTDVLLAAEAFGNYVKLHYATAQGIRQEVERITLQKLVDGHSDRELLRCHRSYAVVISQVQSVSGNAQGLKLKVDDSGLEIPVSRSFIPEVREALG